MKRMAGLLKTSRSDDRILDPKRDIALSSLRRAALVGLRLVTRWFGSLERLTTLACHPAGCDDCVCPD